MLHVAWGASLTIIFLILCVCSFSFCFAFFNQQNGRTKPAYLTLSDDRFTIHITTSKLKKNTKVGKMEVPRPFLKKVTSIGSNDDESDCQSSIDVGSIDRLQKGQTTLRFELARYVK